jgi:hypothetical protein
MESFTFLFGKSGWLIAAVLFVACFGAAEFGFYLARRRSKSDTTLKKDHVNAVQAALAALLGLLLAFSVSMAVTRFKRRTCHT